MSKTGGGVAWLRRLNTQLEHLLRYGSVRTLPGYAGTPPVQGLVRTRRHRHYVHPLADMVARERITTGLYYGGVRFRSDYEAAQVTGTGTINWDRNINIASTASKKAPALMRRASVRRHASRGAQLPQMTTQATQSLERIAVQMSKTHFIILCLVCGRGFYVTEIAGAVGVDYRSISRYFYEALDITSESYMLSIDSREKRP